MKGVSMKMMSKFFLIIFAFTILPIVLMSCNSGHRIELETAEPTDRPTDVVYSFKTWKVTKSTGLYEEADADARMIETLSFGTRVKDISENDYLSECSVTEDIEVCLVVVVDTGQQGYVIKKWLQMQYDYAFFMRFVQMFV